MIYSKVGGIDSFHKVSLLLLVVITLLLFLAVLAGCFPRHATLSQLGFRFCNLLSFFIVLVHFLVLLFLLHDLLVVFLFHVLELLLEGFVFLSGFGVGEGNIEDEEDWEQNGANNTVTSDRICYKGIEKVSTGANNEIFNAGLNLRNNRFVLQNGKSRVCVRMSEY